MNNDTLTWIGVTLLIVLAGVVGFLITTGLYWLVAWSFDLTFSWKIAVGIWIVWVMLHQLFNRGE